MVICVLLIQYRGRGGMSSSVMAGCATGGVLGLRGGTDCFVRSFLIFYRNVCMYCSNLCDLVVNTSYSYILHLYCNCSSCVYL